MQSVFGPAHKYTGFCPFIQFGMPVSNLEICDTMFSDHMSVSYEVGLSCAILTNPCSALSDVQPFHC